NALANYYKVPLSQQASDPSVTHPVIYVAGQGGVFRSTDSTDSKDANGNNQTTWLPFPSAEPNSLSTTPTPPGAGGGLPQVAVTDLAPSWGKIDPTPGRPVAAPGDPNLLTAFTFGQGAFAIRLAPQVQSGLLLLDPTVPGTPGGSDSGNSQADFIDQYTNVN